MVKPILSASVMAWSWSWHGTSHVSKSLKDASYHSERHGKWEDSQWTGTVARVYYFFPIEIVLNYSIPYTIRNSQGFQAFEFPEAVGTL